VAPSYQYIARLSFVCVINTAANELESANIATSSFLVSTASSARKLQQRSLLRHNRYFVVQSAKTKPLWRLCQRKYASLLDILTDILGRP
jgi:hypothetical protein